MKYLQIIIGILLAGQLTAQTEVIEVLPYGDMDKWLVREIKESYLIGGETKYIYEIDDGIDTLRGNIAYINRKSPWATSSVMAHTKGITKGLVSVYPETRGSGSAARLETIVDQIKVLGIVNINVLVSGTIFLGQMIEPVRDTRNPYSKLSSGIPFKKKPNYLQFDYKVRTGGEKKMISGLSAKGKALGEKDMAEIIVILQKRWEDVDGKIHATRVGTGWMRMAQSVNSWQNGHRIPIRYGDISNKLHYKDYMSLQVDDNAYHAVNSKGEIVPIIEESWGTEQDLPTHLILQFSSSNGGPFTGSPESVLWIDNVGLVYKQ